MKVTKKIILIRFGHMIILYSEELDETLENVILQLFEHLKITGCFHIINEILILKMNMILHMRGWLHLFDSIRIDTLPYYQNYHIN